MEISLFATVIQAVGTLLVAALLWELTRVIKGQFLSYWAFGWLLLSVSLFSLTVTFSPRFKDTDASLFLTIAYCIFSYAFGYFLWAGCRNFSTGKTVSQRDIPFVIGPFIIGFTLPVLFPTINLLLPMHALLMGGFFILSFLAIRRYSSRVGHSGIGQKLIQATLLGLAILFWHYTAVVGYVIYYARDENLAPDYLQFSSIFDALIEIGLSFGMVVLATDRVREELEERNQQLANATEKLSRAAKTDPLTGLFNRRAFEEFATSSMAEIPGVIAVLDLNDLKRINDHYLHAAGDAAIQIVARAMRNQFRVTDPLYRMGGDEFMVIMPGGSIEELTNRMNKIDNALHEQRLPGVVDLLDLHIAWGVQKYSNAGELLQAFAKADRAMYDQKLVRKSAG